MEAPDKESLRKDFSNRYKEFYSTKLFEDEGFIRKQCKLCGKFFWTLDADRELCGDPEHESYSFFKSKPIDISYYELWQRFADFFKRNGHTEISRYPVVSRWRQDLYFTIASIQDFQRIEHGKMSFEYPANPLIVPQICLRFNDIPNAGVSGRHFTSFMMAGQHAFNYPEEGYWRDRTIELNFKLLTEILGVDKNKLTYVEDVWAMNDMSEFGPCLESFSGGLELVNSVFTQFGYDGSSVYELNSKVVDVGWGFERLLWFYTGRYTAYEAVFKNEIDYIEKTGSIKFDHELYSKIASISGMYDLSEGDTERYINEITSKAGIDINSYNSIIRPMQATYAILDHLRTLLFAITDGALPSNVGGGYNIRIILRRAFDFIDLYNIELDYEKLLELIALDLKGLYPELLDNIDTVKKVISIERERYNKTRENAKKILSSIKDIDKLDAKTAKLLYESHGITPHMLKEYTNISPEKLDSLYREFTRDNIAERHKKSKDQLALELKIDLSSIKKTEKLYYKNYMEAEAEVLYAKDRYIILDKTPFYPEGGGQESDKGYIDNIRIEDVQIVDDVVIHIADKPIKELSKGMKVICKVDKERRLRLMAHHTATHLISAAARKVLGKHAWQEGAHKGFDKAHIDITHYERLSDEEVKAIERQANDYILNGIRVNIKEMERGEAESIYGFSIYQGHGMPTKRLRIVEITDTNGELIDAEACGGLHLMNMESRVGLINILKSYRIHDGIDRIEFTAGYATYSYISSIKEISKRFYDRLNIELNENGLEQLSNRIEQLNARIRSYNDELLRLYRDYIINNKNNELITIKETPLELKDIIKLSEELMKDNKLSIIAIDKEGSIIAMSNKENALDLINRYARSIGKGFKGGGNSKLAQGRLV
ncbi:MAG: alanine--tRNA ligase [Candidatus Micrarchaeota archaeon]|nr:MAG: alanine--tRNA ligase [Candidatus Micrarchaeota archaeon]